MIAQQELPRLRKLYKETIGPAVMEKFALRNVHQLPRVVKIVINCGVGRFLENQKLKPEVRDTVADTLSIITGQRSIMVKAKKSVSNFKVRAGAPSALMVTLRGDRMWHFLDRLVNLAIPRIRDFRGLKDTAFDPAGNYSMGLADQTVFPEIDLDKLKGYQGMNITMVTNTQSDDIAIDLLERLGMPFRKPDAAD